jgi:hypothetical protein
LTEYLHGELEKSEAKRQECENNFLELSREMEEKTRLIMAMDDHIKELNIQIINLKNQIKDNEISGLDETEAVKQLR